MYTADWRWLLDREETPWYPAMRLFRQKSPGAWDEVVERVVDKSAGASISDIYLL
ncbi:MAG: hypothetical protein WDO73_08840 [Ignavibacteriota bacterium]